MNRAATAPRRQQSPPGPSRPEASRPEASAGDASRPEASAPGASPRGASPPGASPPGASPHEASAPEASLPEQSRPDLGGRLARPRRRFGLRPRVTVAFATGAAVLSAALSLTTFALVHHYLLGERQSTAVHEAYVHARVLKRDLTYAGANLGEALSSVIDAQGTTALAYRQGEWYSASVSLGESLETSRPGSLPASLVKMVNDGTPASQRVISQGQPAIVVGIPLASVHADYFEIQSLAELDHTLTLLAVVLFSCSAATTVGGLLVGRWASGRLVRPLHSIADVAAAIAGGALDQRLPPSDDPDLSVLAASFNEMVAALEERIRRDARFASDVSHELRSPLTTVQATVELLEASRASLSPDSRRALDLLSAEIRRFSEMVQDLLEISRFDAGAANLDLEELPLDDLVANTVAAYSGGSVPVTVTPQAHGTWLLGDRRRLQRVFVNLLDNAQAYGGGAIDVRVDRHGNEAEVAVEDGGPGVQPAERVAIFERFYRGAASGRRSGSTGTGLGLALVAEHVKAHHGRVHVTDRPGGGARFIVSLPLASVMRADGA
jgi:two-component system, OmpR family, sensor histidine kinase MtrB